MGSTSLSGILRIVLGVLGAIVFLGGLLIAGQGGSLAASAFWPIIVGVALMIIALYEQGRYRTEHPSGGGPGPSALGSRRDDTGPGGGPGEAGPASRFERTEEVFTDPSSGQLTRVWYDPATGRREYRPER